MATKKTLNTEWGEVTISELGYYGGLESFLMKGSNDVHVRIDLDMPNIKDQFRAYTPYRYDEPEDFLASAEVVRLSNLSVADVEVYKNLLEFAQYVLASYNAGNAELVEIVRERRAQAAAERKKREDELHKERVARAKAEKEAREARKAQMQERKEMLLNEFMGETGRVRARGYKSMAWPVTVDAREGPDGEFIPYFRYGNPDDYWRSGRLEDIMVFDIKVGSRYKEVWADGDFDLPYYDRSDKERNVVKYDGELLQ